jgi:hypothetical protein
MAALSYQGISDQVAHDYMAKHGRVAWADIDQKLGRGAARRSQEHGPLDRGRRQADRRRYFGAQLSASDRHPGQFKANHAYGAACYRPGGCADIIQAVAERIDARQFNPATFPRFVQHAVWLYCSQSGLDICNGNRVEDSKRCANLDFRVRLMCDRIALRKASEG